MKRDIGTAFYRFADLNSRYAVSLCLLLLVYLLSQMTPPFFQASHNCVFRYLTALPCPGCGVTSAVSGIFYGSPTGFITHPTVWVGALAAALRLGKHHGFPQLCSLSWWALLLGVTVCRWVFVALCY